MGHGFCNRLGRMLTFVFCFVWRIAHHTNTSETWLCRGCRLGTEWCICFFKKRKEKKDQMASESGQVGVWSGAEAKGSSGIELKSSVSVHSVR